MHSCLLPALEHVLLQGAQAHAAGVLFPSDDDTLHRTILIANINPLINTEQVCCNSRCISLLMLVLCCCLPAVYDLPCGYPGEATIWLLWPSQELPHGWQQPVCLCGVLITRGKLLCMSQLFSVLTKSYPSHLSQLSWACPRCVLMLYSICC